MNRQVLRAREERSWLPVLATGALVLGVVYVGWRVYSNGTEGNGAKRNGSRCYVPVPGEPLPVDREALEHPEYLSHA